MEQLGNLFEFFVTTGIKTMDQDVLLQATVTPNRRDVSILTIFPNPVERNMNPVLMEIGTWCFALGVKVIKEGDSKFQKIEEYYKVDDNNATMNDLNYFVVNDFKQSIKYYCTSAYFYEKMFIITQDEKLIQVYVPKAFCVISKYPAYIPQRSFIMQLMKIQRLRLSQNRDKDRIIVVQRGQKEYQIEEIKLYDFYIRTALNECRVVQDNVEYRLKFSSSEVWMNYYVCNSYLVTQYQLFRPSNNLFDVLIFNQPVYNLYKIHLYIMLEYQIIFVSRKPAGITLFAQSLAELMAPLQWRGLFIPFLRPGSFDFQRSNLPYIIGLDRNLYEINEKPLPKDMRRVIYDIDEGRFLTKSDDPKCPKMFQNYLIRKLNTVFADLKFHENEFFEEGIVRYRQAFYNFKLLLLNDIYKYFSTDPVAEGEKKVVLFNYKKFLASFEAADQPFFLAFLKTLSFQQFVKELYRVMEYKDDFIKNNTSALDYQFSAVLQFFDDMRFLSIRFNEQTLDDKVTMLENLQNQYVKDILERNDESSKFKVVEMKITDFIPEYLEHLKGSSLNLSTEMQALSKYMQICQAEEEKSEKPHGGPIMQQSESQGQQNISQVSSQLSNEEAQDKDSLHNQLPQMNWDVDNESVSSRHSDLYQVKHMNLLHRKNHMRRKNVIEGEEDEEIKQNTTTFLVTNMADKNLLSNTNQLLEPNLSMAAKSYFNKSIVPLIGDYGNVEIMVPHRDDVI